ELEIKSKREFTHAYITLFTKSPTHPRKANTILRDYYGEPYIDKPSLKRINTSLFATKCNNFCNRFSFMLVNNIDEEKVIIIIKDICSGEVIDDTIFWTYEDLKKCLVKKLKTLFFVSAESKIENDNEFFHYNKAEIYVNPCINKLLALINSGKIMVDIRIGSFRSGVKEGKIHDHGTAFRLKLKDLPLLYEEVVKIE
ncbi:MAG: MvaI/BcnI family restriction endonuclease, partial [Rikenellaceae bacterium]